MVASHFVGVCSEVTLFSAWKKVSCAMAIDYNVSVCSDCNMTNRLQVVSIGIKPWRRIMPAMSCSYYSLGSRGPISCLSAPSFLCYPRLLQCHCWCDSTNDEVKSSSNDYAARISYLKQLHECRLGSRVSNFPSIFTHTETLSALVKHG